MLLKPVIEQNGNAIEGVLYTPNGEGPFPTVILTHGFTGNYTYITGNIAKELADAGFAAYAFNLRNPDTRSMLNTSVLTEAATLDTVIDQIKALDCVDPEQVFLLGESQGGFVSAYVAARRESPPGARTFRRWFCTTRRSCCRMTRRREIPAGMNRGTFFRMILPLA